MWKPIYLATFLMLFLHCQQKATKEEFYDSGKLKLTLKYSDKNLTMLLEETAYYESGQKKYQGKYKNNLREGLWQHWYENGNLWSECEYLKGEKNGRNTLFYSNGKKKIETYYEHGKLVGEPITFDDQEKN